VTADRNHVIAEFDRTVVALQGYIEQVDDSKELARLCGILPELRDVRHQFERATAPDEDP
jgi:hypothetical protein